MFFILDNKYKENQSIQDVTLPIIEIKSNLKLCFIIFKKIILLRTLIEATYKISNTRNFL